MRCALVLPFSLGLLLVDVAPAADSLNVRLVGTCDTPGYANSVAIGGDYAYVTEGDSGLVVVSIADPAHPVRTAWFVTSNYARDVAVSGDYAYVCETALLVISVADPTRPAPVGHCVTYDATDVAVNGDYVYLADYGGGLKVISIADPANPTVVGHCGTPEWANGVAVSGGYAYVTDYLNGHRVISIADPTRPYEVGKGGPTGGFEVAVAGSYAYIADGDSGLRVVSVADPADPKEVGHCPAPGAFGVTLSGDYAYVGAKSAGLRVVSIADPTHPVELGRYDTPGTANGAAVDRGFCVVSDGYSGLEVYQFYGGGVEESPNAEVRMPNRGPTVLSGDSFQSLKSSVVFDAMGRRMLNPRSGVLFIREPSAVGGQPSVVREVVIAR